MVTWLLDPTGFPPRWHCGSWSDALGWTTIGADIGIYTAYMAIPLVLAYLTRRKRSIFAPHLTWLFVAFIVLCGHTHLVEAIIFWSPVYRLSAVLKVATAVVSWATVAALVIAVPKLLALRTPAELEVEVEARTRELERQQAESTQLAERLAAHSARLEDANEKLRAFSYAVSHDLRAPLRAIDGYAGILAEDYAEKLDEDGLELLETVRRNAQRMGALIDAVARLSRLARSELHIMDVPIREVAEEVWAVMNVSTATLIVETDLTCRADRALLGQLFDNLLRNAVKFSAGCESPTIRITAEPTEDGVTISVQDNGIGFRPSDAERIFEVFQRLHTAEEYEGTGAGLAIVKAVVDRHGGRIIADGTPGEGATFHVTLPG